MQLDADLEELVGVEEDVGEVAVLLGHAELLGGRPVDVLDAEVRHGGAAPLRAEEEPVEVRLAGVLLRLVGRDALRLAPAAERVEPPAVLAVPAVGVREPLERDVLAVEPRPLHDLRPGHGRRAVALELLAGEAQRLELREPLAAAACRGVLLEERVRVERGGGEGQAHRGERGE
ncbi:MAG: hypothetical protein QM704_25985 [Anaeromyxobacteraceae bacterium]